MLGISWRVSRRRSLDNNTQAFFALVRAGLWEKEARQSAFENVNLKEIYQLAHEQSVVGLLAARLQQTKDVHFPQEEVLTIVGDTLQLEQRNIAMNSFVGETVGNMRSVGIYTLLVKGQGIAQCYERPLWRASGDVDFLLSRDNFIKACNFFKPLVANGLNPSNEDARSIQVSPWNIELHTNQFCGLSNKIDKVIEEVQNSVFNDGDIRSWMNNRIQFFLPSADCDEIFIFTHFLKHFNKGGLGLRQVCDWCRLMWVFKDSIIAIFSNLALLKWA